MRAKEIMQPLTTKWLQPEQTLYEAICAMREITRQESHINGMVVLEHGLRLVGVVSIKDVIRAVVPSYLVENLSEFSWEGLLEARAKKVRSILVKEIMSTNLVTVEPDDLVIACADLLIVKQLQRLPVVEKSGKVIGMVHIRDIYRAITDLICSQET
jgi:CBS domain-containing protein